MKNAMNYLHLFGPVQSRRLGVSLGVDMVPAKLCTLNCVYCECGTTSALTIKRKEYVSADAIIAELTDYLKTEPVLDYITFGGSGEPTLNTGIKCVIRYLKKSYPHYRCALLTNGTLLSLPEVRSEILPFDLVLPSLDAVSDQVFATINRPHRGLDAAGVINGLAAFRKEYAGTIWLEIFVVPGVNDTAEELQLLKGAAKKINPDRVQLNTLDRPGACDWVEPATASRLDDIAHAFAPLPVEIILRQAANQPIRENTAVSPESVRSLIVRRPSTLEEIAGLAGLTINETKTILSTLVASKAIAPHTVGSRIFYNIL